MYVLQNWSFAPGDELQGTITIPGEYQIEQFAHITNLTRNIPLFDPELYEATMTLELSGGQTILTLRQNTSFCDPDDELQIVMYDLYSGGGGGPTSDVAVTNWPASQNVNGTVNVGNFPAAFEVSNDVGNPLPVSGSVSVSNFPASVEVSNDVGNPLPVSGSVAITNSSIEISNDAGNPIPVTGTVTALTEAENPLVFDSFGRSRVSEGFTLGDYKNIYGLDDSQLSKTNGTGSAVTFLNYKAAARLTCGTAPGSYAIRQSRMYHNYQPGKSQLIYMSFGFLGAENNAVKRVGYYDDRNGIFLELDGAGNLFIVQRSDVSGVPVDTRIPQSSWNVDPMNGSGPSGYNIDVTKVQLMAIDYQWLGVGKIRVSFAINDSLREAHVINHVNLINSVYWSQPSLPTRSEVYASDVLSNTANMDSICSTVISEGGYAEAGSDNSISSAVRTVGSTGATLPLMAIRLKDTRNGFPNRAYVRLDAADIFAPAQNVLVKLIRVDSHTAITGGSWVSAGNNSAVEYNLAPTSYTAGANDVVFNQFFIASGGTGGGNNVAAPVNISNPSASKKGFIAQNIDSNDSMAFLVVVTSLGSGANAAGVLQWREIY